MALKENAKYHFSVCFVRVTPLNDDLTQPEAANIIGGAGPFDFSGAAVPAAVPLLTKIDAGAAEQVDLDLVTPPVADIAAVTVAELITAITTAAPTDVTASAEAITGRLKLVFASGTVVQAYGEAAELSLIGQGQGVRVVSTNTMKSFSETPILKDEETITTTDAKGIDTEVVTDGYRKGNSGAYVDASSDFLMRSIFEGGSIDSVTGVYSVPNSTSRKVYFKIEVFEAKYLLGTNKEFEIDSYQQTVIYSAKGTYGETSRDRNFSDANFTYTATSPKLAGVISADTDYIPLTVEEFEALLLEDISA